MDEAQMSKLLNAIKEDDKADINALACGHFITSDGHCNWENMKAFEEFSGCVFFPIEKDSFGWLVGGIKYGKRTYSYG